MEIYEIEILKDGQKQYSKFCTQLIYCHSFIDKLLMAGGEILQTKSNQQEIYTVMKAKIRWTFIIHYHLANCFHGDDVCYGDDVVRILRDKS